jgi:alpha-galactosidase
VPKITFIGAGSTVFARNLLGDILSRPELASSTICLFDIDADRLATSELVARKVVETLGAPATITATTDRRRAFDGADHAINMIQVGGYAPCTVTDFEIPKKYGLRQTIADTLGIGGIMRGLRTIPVLLDMCRDLEELAASDVTLLNYTNPMSMLCMAVSRASRVRTVGLCHSVQHTSAQIAADIGVPIEEISYLSAGINHMSFFVRFERDGEDLYPLIRRVLAEERVPHWNQVRYELLRHFGYFVTESSEHLAEYVPWFIKRDRPDLVERLNIPLDEYPRRCEAQIAHWDAERARLEAGEGFEVKPSLEYGSGIIASLETNEPRVVYGNVPNDGLIDNLPRDCSVEVPCLVDGTGIHPTKVGSLPPQLAALITTNVNVQQLTVEAALTGRRDHVYQAAMLDPHTAAELTPDEIVGLVDDLIAAHADWLPAFPNGAAT